MSFIRTMGVASLAMMATSLAFGQIYSNRSTDTRLPALNPLNTSDSGVAAPLGGMWSEVENDAGNTTESNTTAGFAAYLVTTVATGEFRLADDFVVPAGHEFRVNTVRVYAYRSGLIASANDPFTAVGVKIWNGRPGDTGSTVIVDVPAATFTQTDQVPVAIDGGGNTVLQQVFRCFNTQVPAPGTVPGVTRRIFQVSANIPPTVLGPGTYWVDYQLVQNVAYANATFAPSTTHNETRTPQNPVGGGNGRQMATAGVWADALDTGNPATAPDIAQEMPFLLNGSIRLAPSSGPTGVWASVLGGNLASLGNNDNNAFVIVADEFNTDTAVRVGFVSPLSKTSSFDVGVRSFVTRPDVFEFVDVWNFPSNDWENVTVYAASENSYQVNTASITNAANYVGSGNGIRVQVRTAPAESYLDAPDWSIFYDVINVVVAP